MGAGRSRPKDSASYFLLSSFGPAPVVRTINVSVHARVGRLRWGWGATRRVAMGGQSKCSEHGGAEPTRGAGSLAMGIGLGASPPTAPAPSVTPHSELVKPGRRRSNEAVGRNSRRIGLVTSGATLDGIDTVKGNSRGGAKSYHRGVRRGRRRWLRGGGRSPRRCRTGTRR